MDFSVVANLKKRKAADLLVIPFWAIHHQAQLAANIEPLQKDVLQPLTAGDFKGKEREVLFIYPKNELEPRIVFLGLGEEEKLTKEILRRVYGSLIKACHSRKINEINILMPKITKLIEEEVLKGVVEGLMLSNYQYTKLKNNSIKDNPPHLVQKATLIETNKSLLSLIKQHQLICEGVYFARDLVNANADESTADVLSNVALNLAKTLPNVKATIFDKKRIEKEKLDLLLAVNKGSEVDPAFIILEYKGNPKSKDHTVLIGKGITYDTGGLNLKLASMDLMKADMAGAAVALATIWVAAKIELPIHLTAIIPVTDNCISAKSYKPGDVYRSHAGLTVEISNTDAEGRLILADALSYAEKNLKPTRMIDFATLTGGIDIALGHEATGMMANNDVLADLFIRAGMSTFERVWRLPLYDEYKDNLRSDIADIKNIGTRSASSITGAIFLQHFFSNKIPWVHFDIASTAFLAEAKRYHPKFGTGVGVRLMIEFLKNLH
jgi:leucyl aminopeptidase